MAQELGVLGRGQDRRFAHVKERELDFSRNEAGCRLDNVNEETGEVKGAEYAETEQEYFDRQPYSEPKITPTHTAEDVIAALESELGANIVAINRAIPVILARGVTNKPDFQRNSP